MWTMRLTTLADALCFTGGLVGVAWGATTTEAAPILLGSIAAWFAYPLVIRGAIPAVAALCTPSVDKKGVSGALQQPVTASLTPIVYSPGYDITAGGLEASHPFDSTKYSRVMHALREGGFASPSTTFTPRQLPLGVLAQSQSPLWLAALGYGSRAMIALELTPLAWLPSWAVWWRVLEPMQLAMAGSVGAVDLALSRPEGWAINLSGGYHHARHGFGHGFCVHNDLSLAVRHAFAKGCRRILYLDLDVHQGDGFERDFGEDERVSVLDAFRPDTFPADETAACCSAIVVRGKTFHHAFASTGSRFLAWLRTTLPKTLKEFDPDLVIYNAGTDILEGDPLGGLRIPAEGVIERDEIVFQACGIGSRHSANADAVELLTLAGGRKRPVAMMLSGGYQDRTARVIADSILNLELELGIKSDDRA